MAKNRIIQNPNLNQSESVSLSRRIWKALRAIVVKILESDASRGIYL